MIYLTFLEMATHTGNHLKKNIHSDAKFLLLLLQLFYDPLSGTTQVSRYKKDKPFWILLKQTWWRGSGISWTICKLFALPCRRYHASTSSVRFLWAGSLPDTQPTASKHWRHAVKMKLRNKRKEKKYCKNIRKKYSTLLKMLISSLNMLLINCHL